MTSDFPYVQKELVEIERDKNSGVSVVPIGGQLSRLTGTIKGPSGTPYEVGKHSSCRMCLIAGAPG
jgi:ubiquitin-protein ligase